MFIFNEEKMTHVKPQTECDLAKSRTKLFSWTLAWFKPNIAEYSLMMHPVSPGELFFSKHQDIFMNELQLKSTSQNHLQSIYEDVRYASESETQRHNMEHAKVVVDTSERV